jgi:peptide/nickel transport system substrate-binding protein
VDTRGADLWSRRHVLKGAGLTALVAAGGWLTSACSVSAPSSPAPATPQAVKGGTLVEAPPIEGLNVNPLMANALGVTSMMFDGLLVVLPDGSLGPLLAQSVPKVSDDGLTYRFDLRKDVKWSDGTALTADDVVFTYNVMTHPDYQSFPSPYRANLTAILADVQAPDPYTIVMKTTGVAASFLALHSAYGVLPKHVLGDVPPDNLKDHPYNLAPTVSSGPFKYKEWIKGDHMTVERNDTCYRGAPYLDQYVLKFFAQQTGIVTGLQTGEVDATFLTQESVFDQLKAAPNLNLNVFINGITCPRPTYNLDPSAPVSQIFSSKAVRQALLYGADRESAARSTLFGYAVKPSSTGVFLPGSWAENPSAQPDYPFDKQKAQDLLDADGWRTGPSGIREKNGVPLRFELLTSVNNNVWVQQSTILQQNWKDIGVDVTLRPQQFAQVITATLARDFEMVMSQAPYASTPADPDPSSAFHSRNAVKNVGQNYSGYKNPQLDTLLDQAVATFDQAKRKELYFKIQDILNDDVPLWSTWYWQVAWVTNKRVKSVGPERMGPYTFQSRTWANEWYVTDGK